jgi:hypothetical protein
MIKPGGAKVAMDWLIEDYFRDCKAEECLRVLYFARSVLRICQRYLAQRRLTSWL